MIVYWIVLIILLFVAIISTLKASFTSTDIKPLAVRFRLRDIIQDPQEINIVDANTKKYNVYSGCAFSDFKIPLIGPKCNCFFRLETIVIFDLTKVTDTSTQVLLNSSNIDRENWRTNITTDFTYDNLVSYNLYDDPTKICYIGLNIFTNKLFIYQDGQACDFSNGCYGPDDYICPNCAITKQCNKSTNTCKVPKWPPPT